MAAKRSKDDTPAMRQFHHFKQQHPDCLLLFRMGDFYETFYDDAKLAAKVLGVTLTQRTEGVPMAGVPYHAVEGYLRRLIQAGYRVAVCDQVEDPKHAKGVVKRDVTRVITPGTLTDESMLDEGRQNPLAAVAIQEGKGKREKGKGGQRKGEHAVDEPTAYVAWAELSTGAFQLASFSLDVLADELARIGPSELLVVDEDDPSDTTEQHRAALAALPCPTTARPTWQFRPSEGAEALRQQFEVATLEGFGLTDDDPALGPAGAIIHYLHETQRMGQTEQGPADAPARIAHLLPPRRFERADHLVIDQTSLRSLEVERTVRSEAIEGSLLAVIQSAGGCRTAMGKRALRHWLCYPLASRGPIEERQQAVAALVADARLLDELRDALDQVQDVQRIVGRIAVNRATPRDLVGLGRSTQQADALTKLLGDTPAMREDHNRLREVAKPLAELAATIANACVEAPPAHLREGGLIRDGFDTELDETRSLRRDSNAWLARYQKQLIDDSGISSLKVGYNKVFGYYIEVTAANKGKADQYLQTSEGRAWTRKQTLKNAERYITAELKTYEDKVLGADQRATAREQALFADLCAKAQGELPALHAYAEAVARLDVLACFARCAVRRRYVQPTIVDEPVLDIQAGRHPVLDEVLGDRFVPNDVGLGSGVSGLNTAQASDDDADPRPQTLDPSPASLALITGPNMAGKSTYIRQAALITLLAHTGSFVPAESATVGLCDRIFTRIGASDELHTGQSTFMVEMTETANICHHATAASLVILDEIGRGTSTLDGLALAWAIAEHLAARRCRTLFATHYHELTALADQYDHVANLNVTVREWKDQVVFLHRIAPGKTDRSYGIHVAKIAGLPAQVVGRADDLLGQLAVSHNGAERAGEMKQAKPKPADQAQLGLFTEYVEHPALEELREADLDRLSPLEAFDLLRKLRDDVEKT